MKDQFIGRWKLLSCVAQSGDEKAEPIGANPFGMLFYMPDYMSVFLAKSQRTNFSVMDMHNVPADEIISNFPDFEAYCGTYNIDEETKIVAHNIECAKVPNWIGMDFRRYYQFHDNQLTLTTVDDLSVDNKDWSFVLEWEKVENL